MLASCFPSLEWAFWCNPETCGNLNEITRRGAMPCTTYQPTFRFWGRIFGKFIARPLLTPPQVPLRFTWGYSWCHLYEVGVVFKPFGPSGRRPEAPPHSIWAARQDSQRNQQARPHVCWQSHSSRQQPYKKSVLLSARILFFVKDFQKNQSLSHWYTIRNNKSAQNADDMFSALIVAPLRGASFGVCLPPG